MTGSLTRASAAVVLRSPAPALAAAAGLLVLTTAPYLQGGHEHQVRVGAATLLACTLAATAEEPAAEVAAATPCPAWMRGGSRLLLGLLLVVPVVILTLSTGAGADRTSVGVPAVQMVALVSTGPAVGFGFTAWGRGQPAYAATVGVVCLTAALWLLPLDWSVTKVGPEVAADDFVLRCAALALLGFVVVAAAWRDPASSRSGARVRSRRGRP